MSDSDILCQTNQKMLFIKSVNVSGGTLFVVNTRASLVRQLMVWIDLTDKKEWMRLLEFSNTVTSRPIRELHDKCFEPQHGRKWPCELRSPLWLLPFGLDRGTLEHSCPPPLLYLILSKGLRQRCGDQYKVRDFGYHCGLAHGTETRNWLPGTDLSTG